MAARTLGLLTALLVLAGLWAFAAPCARAGESDASAGASQTDSSADTDAEPPSESPASLGGSTEPDAAAGAGETKDSVAAGDGAVEVNAQAGTAGAEAAEAAGEWEDAAGWGAVGFSYYGTAGYWHSFDRTSGTDKHEGELALTFSLDEYSGRFRVGNFHPFANSRRDLRLEKYELNWPLGRLEATAGTFAQMLGKGLVLAGIEMRELDYDNELEGLRVSLPGERFSATAFIGQHKRVTDPGATKLWGAHVEAKPAEWLSVGGNLLSYQQPPGGGASGRQHHQALSAEAALSLEVFSASFEYMRLDWPQDSDGRGMYGSASVSLPGFGLTYEYKDYWRIHGPFAAAPPVRYDPEHAKADLLDEKGHGFQLTCSPFADGSFIEASYAQSNIRHRGWPSTEFIAAYRSAPARRFTWMAQRRSHRDSLLIERAYHAEAAYQWNDDFTTQASLELRGVDEGSGMRDEQEVSLDFGYGGWLTVVLTQERSERGRASSPQRWNLVEIRLQESGVQELALAYGKRRAGFVCSGGVCRLEPEFDGWKLEYRLFF